MDKQDMMNPTNVVVEEANKIETAFGTEYMGEALIVGGILGLLWKGIPGAVVGMIVGVTAIKLYENKK